MNHLGKVMPALALAATLLVSPAHATDSGLQSQSSSGWVNSHALDGSTVAAMPYAASFEELAAAGVIGQPNQLVPGGVSAVIPTAVPEPTTYMLMLAGLAIVGFIGRRQRKS
jgi:hypothetical protein